MLHKTNITIAREIRDIDASCKCPKIKIQDKLRIMKIRVDHPNDFNENYHHIYNSMDCKNLDRESHYTMSREKFEFLKIIINVDLNILQKSSFIDRRVDPHGFLN